MVLQDLGKSLYFLDLNMAKYFSGKTELFIKVCGPLWTSSEKKIKVFPLEAHAGNRVLSPRYWGQDWPMDSRYAFNSKNHSFMSLGSVKKMHNPHRFPALSGSLVHKAKLLSQAEKTWRTGFWRRIWNSLLISIICDSHQGWKSSYTSCQKIIFMEIWQLQMCQCKVVELLTHCLDRAH